MRDAQLRTVGGKGIDFPFTVRGFTDETETLHFAVHALREHLLEIRLALRQDHAAGSGNRLDEMLELNLDVFDAAEDVGVVELEVPQYDGTRQIVDELRALVELEV